MSKTVYKYTDDSWFDGSEDCPCCSGLEFECYNAVGWEQNGSATSMWNLYVDVIVAHKAKEYEVSADRLDGDAYYLYEGFTLEELATLCDRLDIVLEKVSSETL